MKTQSYKLEGLAQANAVLTSYNSDVMEQFAKINVTKKIHASAAEDIVANSNKSNKNQEKFLMLELQKQLYAWK